MQILHPAYKRFSGFNGRMSCISMVKPCAPGVVAIILEIPPKETNIGVRRSSVVGSPRSSVGEGTSIEAAAFVGQKRPHFSELKRIIEV